MRIIYHHRTQGTGVEGVHIRSIATALQRLNHKVTVVSPPGCDPMKEITSFSKKNENKSMIKAVFSIISRYSPEFIFELMELAYNLPAYFRLKKEVEKQKVDLIYERYFLYSLSSMLIARRYRIPIFFEVNDSSYLPRLRKLLFIGLARCIEKRILSKADCVITVSGYFRKRLIKAGIPADKIKVCHNAVDDKIFDPTNIESVPTAIPKDRFVLGFLGLFVEWVGLDTMIKLFSIIHKDYPDTHLLLVGTGPEEERIKRQIDDCDLQNNVTITGRIPHAQVPTYINMMDICIIPRHERYTSPVKLFEYMAMGKAVLVPAYEAICEVVDHGRNGMLFEPGSEKDFLNVLTSMIDNKANLKNISENARNDVLQNYTWQNNALTIENEFNHLMHNSTI